MRIFALIAALSILAPGFARASGAGSSGAEFLRVAMGARPAALGENYVGLADDVTAAAWNPAGLGQLDKIEVSAMHLSYIGDVSYEFLAASYPFGEWGSAAFSAIYVNIPPFDSTADGSGVAEGSAADGMAAISWGGSFKPLVPDAPDLHNVYYGMTGKLIYRSLSGYTGAGSSSETYTATAGALDIGFFWVASKDLTVGTAVHNLGSTVTFLGDEADALPLALKAGVAWKGWNYSWLKTTLLADLTKPIDPDGGDAPPLWGGIGAEFLVYGMLALRGGFTSAAEGNTVVGGAGVIYGPVSADYAFIPLGNLGSGHRVALTVKFGVPTLKLGAVRDLSAVSGTEKKVVLNWSSLRGAAGYFVELRKAGEKDFSRPMTKPRRDSSVTLRGLSAGTEYVFRVIAVDKKGIEGAPAQVAFTPEDIEGSLEPPANLAADVSEGKISVSWDSVAEAIGYHVYYRTAGGEMRRATSVPRKSTSLTLRGKKGTSYEIAVTTVDRRQKEGPKSGTVTITVSP